MDCPTLVARHEALDLKKLCQKQPNNEGYIHPLPDGNGRTARFLMNSILVANGYPWTIIRLETQPEYMEALEQLSTQQKPEAFVQLILEAIDHDG